jgi:iron complex transport system permease protein
LLVALALVGVALNLTTGAVSISPVKVLAILADHAGLSTSGDVTEAQDAVLWSIRLPRVVLAVIAGAGLGAAGAALQGALRNPLAGPYIIGVSAGAALGGVILVALAAALLESWAAPIGGFVGALLALAVVSRLGRYQGRAEVATLVLSGVALTAAASAAVGLIVVTVENDQLRSTNFWLLGGLSAATWSEVAITLLFVAIGIGLLPLFSRPLDLLALGESEARHLGVDPSRIAREVFVLCALAVGGAVAAIGIVGFVGLLGAHLVRGALGAAHKRVIPAAAVAGAILVLFADLVARNLASPTEIPLGVVTAVVGGPAFLLLLQRTRAKYGEWG